MPEENIIYFGDTLHLPYGTKDLNLVREYVEKIINYLIEEKKVKAVVIACNTATIAALDYVKKEFDLPIFGMSKSSAIRAVELSRNQKIAIIGTEETVKSGAYQNAILEINSEAELFAKACPKFVDLVEEGKFDGDEVQITARNYLKSLIEAEVDSLILGCTHFPYLTPILSRVMGENVRLINPAHEIALDVKNTLTELELIKKGNFNLYENKFIVSDKDKISKRFLENGCKFLNLDELNFNEKNIFIND
jgi:glutamate racemase